MSSDQSASGTSPRTRLCVFCGSNAGASPAHMKMAVELAEAMAARDIELVYGGGTVGLMGAVAKTLVSLKGPDFVHGVIPEPLVRLERDDTYQTLKKPGQYVPDQTKYGHTTVVPDMHTRKKIMAEAIYAGGPGSGFVGLPGGYGTMEELFEVVTWNQLGIHQHGICFLNVEGYWDGILQWVNTAVDQGFVKQANKNIIVTATSAQGAIDSLRDYQVSEGTFKLSWGSQ